MEIVPWGDWDNRRNVITNSGEYFDILFTDQNRYGSEVSTGVLLDITDMLEENAPELYKMIPEDYWNAVEIDGKVYGVPTYKDSSLSEFFVWDQDIADKYEMCIRDSMGGLGMLDQNLPVYMSEDSLKLYRRLEACGDIQVKGHKNCIGIPYGESFTVGDITVEVEAIDHDVVGACGYRITTPGGTICYTGDYRFHGFHPEITKAFGQKMKGVDVLITEGVTVSFDDVDILSLTKPEEPERSEEWLQDTICKAVSYTHLG